MFGFQTVPKSKQNRSDFGHYPKTKLFGNGTDFRVQKSRRVWISDVDCIYNCPQKLYHLPQVFTSFEAIATLLDQFLKFHQHCTIETIDSSGFQNSPDLGHF